MVLDESAKWLRSRAGHSIERDSVEGIEKAYPSRIIWIIGVGGVEIPERGKRRGLPRAVYCVQAGVRIGMSIRKVLAWRHTSAGSGIEGSKLEVCRRGARGAGNQRDASRSR